MGGSRAVRTGLVFVKNVPLAGALIGASANATILYALGYADCRFYEAKLDPEVAETATETLQDIKQKSDSDLEVAIAQQAMMDQVLAHMILASYPEKGLGGHSAEPATIGAASKFVASDRQSFTSAASRCNTIAQLDGQASAEETKVLEAISEKFDLDLNTLQARLSSTDATLDHK